MVLIFSLLFLSACGGQSAPKEWTENGLSVEKDGKVIYCVVESFDKGFYDVDELTGMAVEEAAIFNGKNKSGETTPVTVSEVSLVKNDENEDENLVRVVYLFDGTDSYEKFQQEKLYYGTLENAVKERHVFSGAVVTGVGGDAALDEKTVARLGGNHVIVTDCKNKIYLPYDLLYYSEGVEILGDGTVDTTKCEYAAILVMKK